MSALTYLIKRRTVDSAFDWVFDKVHENLSVGVDIALPTWFAVSLWALFGLLAWIHGKLDSRRRPSWMFLALISWTASIDEFLMLHERLSKPASLIEEASGIDLGDATWVLIGGFVAIGVGATLARLIFALPSTARRDVMLGGALFLIGAIGFELAGVVAFNLTGSYGWLYMTTMHIEEGLEFAGLILAIRGLLGLLPFQIEANPAVHAQAGAQI